MSLKYWQYAARLEIIFNKGSVAFCVNKKFKKLNEQTRKKNLSRDNGFGSLNTS